MNQEYFAKTLPGLENVLKEELASFGCSDINIASRGVTFWADDEAFYRSLASTRLALRILLPLKKGHIEKEDDLYDLARSIPWHDHIMLKNTIAVDTVTLHRTINHSIFISQRTKDGVADYFRDRFGERPSVDLKKPDVLIHVHLGSDGDCTMGLDAAGHSLNQRGYRQNAWKAPLNEVLAAGLIKLTGWDPETPFVDPMCGSGTLLIEAAFMAKNKIPALIHDNFGIKTWPFFRKGLWSTVVDDARAKVRKDVDWIFGSDIDQLALNATRDNISKAKLMMNIKLKLCSVENSFVPPGPGTLITNPPYGERIGEKDEIREIYPRISSLLRNKAHGYTAGFITADEGFKKKIGLKADKTFSLMNGNLDAEFLVYSIYK